MNKYENSGAIFNRNKKSDKGPDMGGDFTLGGEVLDYIIRQYESGQEVKLDISAWRRHSNNGGTFMSLKIDRPYSERSGNAPRREERRDERPRQGSFGPRDQEYNPRHSTKIGGSDRDNPPRENSYSRARGNPGYDNPPRDWDRNENDYKPRRRNEDNDPPW